MISALAVVVRLLWINGTHTVFVNQLEQTLQRLKMNRSIDEFKSIGLLNILIFFFNLSLSL